MYPACFFKEDNGYSVIFPDLNGLATCGETMDEAVDVAAYAKEHFDKFVRKNLTIPAWLDSVASEMGINFSQVLQEALLAKVQAYNGQVWYYHHPEKYE